jgi:hypothetical protein
MARKIALEFIKELQTGSLKPLLEYVQNDDTINMELRGDRVIIYYRGAVLLTVKANSYELVALDKQYHPDTSLIKPAILNIEDYIPKAKHIVDVYVVKMRNHLWEKEIQQRIIQENNYSPNSLDTDYFIIDSEYQDGDSRADVVALQWDSTSSARKLSAGYVPTITIFEIKQGYDSITGTSGIKKHYDDFQKFISDKDKINAFKKDMIAVFKQKRELGLITETGKYGEIISVSDEIKFVFLIANYKTASTQLKTALNDLPNECGLIYANPMGYGLYAKNVIDRSEFIECFL